MASSPTLRSGRARWFFDEHHWSSSLVGLGSCALATLVTLMLWPVIQTHLFIFFIGAVALAAYVGGLRASLTCTAATTILVAVLLRKGWNPPLTVLVWRVGIFLGVAVIICLLSRSIELAMGSERSARDVLVREHNLLRLALGLGNAFAWEWIPTVDDKSPAGGNGSSRKLNLGKDYYDWLRTVYLGDRERVRAAVETAINAGSDFEVDYRLAGGTIFWFRTRGKVEQDSEGHVTRVVGVTQHITSPRTRRTYSSGQSA